MKFKEYGDVALAARLRISVSTLRTWRCRYKELLPPGVKIGRNWFFDEQVVDAWLACKCSPSGNTCSENDSVISKPEKRKPGRPVKTRDSSNSLMQKKGAKS